MRRHECLTVLAGGDTDRDPMDDGLPVAEVGAWARDKLVLIEKYIEISRAARTQYIGKSEATYIDLYCGPGLSRIRDTGEYLLGSPVAAYEAGRNSNVPFNRLLISDADADRVGAARTRLEARGATVVAFNKPAEGAADDVLASLNPHGLHFAFLDPYGLELPFEVIRKLATLKRIDLMMLLSTGDLQRNFRREYVAPDHSRLDTFAPGWRDRVKTSTADDEALRQAVIEYWFSLLSELRCVFWRR